MRLSEKSVKACDLKIERVLFERGISRDELEEERALWGFLSRSIKSAMCFELTSESIDFLKSGVISKMRKKEIIPILQNITPPAPITFVEYPTTTSQDPSKKITSGTLIIYDEESLEYNFFEFMEADNKGMYIPECFVSFNSNKGVPVIRALPTMLRDRENLLSSPGADREKIDIDFNERLEVFGDDTMTSVSVIFSAFQVLNAKNSPFMEDRTGGLSRQAFRALKRKDPDAAERARDTIRIRLNEEGRRYLDADRADRAARPATPRQAHWVRGHLMNAPTKGPVWRRAHVRGEGDPVMRTRILTASGPEPEAH